METQVVNLANQRPRSDHYPRSVNQRCHSTGRITELNPCFKGIHVRTLALLACHVSPSVYILRKSSLKRKLPVTLSSMIRLQIFIF
jgi:hypothetical protein